MQTIFKNKAPKASVSIKIRDQFLWLVNMVKTLSKEETNKLKTDLTKTKVMDFDEIYNFHEGNFVKFKTYFLSKTGFPKPYRVQTIPAHALTTKLLDQVI